MPLINIYSKKNIIQLKKITTDIKKFVAEKLTCKNIKLSPNEISIRFISIDDEDMIGNVEVDITAHAFPERINKQDEICLEVMNFLNQRTKIKNIKVWLKLVELGHSWK